MQATRTGLKKAAKTAKKSTPENKHGTEGTLLGASPEAQAALPTEEELRKIKMQDENAAVEGDGPEAWHPPPGN